ncbi:unnamed protein product [Amoebophrya sp. A120]|nr:unnamed protein product [Amoebophrya sp. A120]|eukprot:GSA120T00025482001.1
MVAAVDASSSLSPAQERSTASSTTTPSLGMKIDEPTTAANPSTAAEKVVARSGQGSKSSTAAHEKKSPGAALVSSSSSALEIARREQKKREYEGDADCKDLGDDKTEELCDKRQESLELNASKLTEEADNWVAEGGDKADPMSPGEMEAMQEQQSEQTMQAINTEKEEEEEGFLAGCRR